jgi:hypothetical protein
MSKPAELPLKFMISSEAEMPVLVRRMVAAGIDDPGRRIMEEMIPEELERISLILKYDVDEVSMLTVGMKEIHAIVFLHHAVQDLIMVIEETIEIDLMSVMTEAEIFVTAAETTEMGWSKNQNRPGRKVSGDGRVSLFSRSGSLQQLSQQLHTS